MGDMGTCWGRSKGAGPCITKNVKYFDFFVVKLFKIIYDPKPIRGLFGKKSDMSEASRLYFKNEIMKLYFPSAFREFWK